MLPGGGGGAQRPSAVGRRHGADQLAHGGFERGRHDAGDGGDGGIGRQAVPRRAVGPAAAVVPLHDAVLFQVPVRIVLRHRLPARHHRPRVGLGAGADRLGDETVEQHVPVPHEVVQHALRQPQLAALWRGHGGPAGGVGRGVRAAGDVARDPAEAGAAHGGGRSPSVRPEWGHYLPRALNTLKNAL